MMAEWVSITINDVPIKAKKGARLIDVAQEHGHDIPRFCYHPKLSVVSSCRMCLVDVEGIGKPQPSCSTTVAEGMVVHTKSSKTLDAQKSIMRFLLMKHPLHCPICDQGGECELQDVAMGYGDGITDYMGDKRSVIDEDLGPLVATDMSLCIHCTRCVRFGDEVAGIKELGLVGRSDQAAISTYLEKGVQSEWSGNMVDLCPVGALTSKPAKFSGRSWDYVAHAGISAHDCVGAHLYHHTVYKGYGDVHEIKRTVPRTCEALNENWITDRDRYSYQGLYSNKRVTRPLVKVGDMWLEMSYEQALERIAIQMNAADKDRSFVAVGPQTSNEDGEVLAQLFRQQGFHNIDVATNELTRHPGESWYEQASPEDIATADTILMLGCSLRWDQPYLSLKVKQAVERGATALSVGALTCHYPYDVSHQLHRPQRFVHEAMTLLKAWEDHDTLSDEWKIALGSKKVVVLVGEEALVHPQAESLVESVRFYAKQHGYGYAMLTQGPNNNGLIDKGCTPNAQISGKRWQTILEKPVSFAWLHQVDPSVDLDQGTARLGAAFVVCCTSHRTAGIEQYADIILPATLPPEMSGSYVNYMMQTQSYAQVTNPPPGVIQHSELYQMFADALEAPLDHMSFVPASSKALAKPEVVTALMHEVVPVVLTHWVNTDLWIRHAPALTQAYPVFNGVMVSDQQKQYPKTLNDVGVFPSADVASGALIVYRNTATHRHMVKLNDQEAS